MASQKQISSALLSVFSKEGLDRIVSKLHELDVTLYSTGGTHSFIKDLGIPVTAVEELTSYPSILGGRVKTLHPKVFGGILGRRDEQSDLDQLAEYEIPEIDLVIVDLYPFEETVASGAADQEIIEKIDIGGISLIRAAAKNHRDVLVVASRDQYESLFALLEAGNGTTSAEQRRAFATEAFNVSSQSQIPQVWRESPPGREVLRGPGYPVRAVARKGDLIQQPAGHRCRRGIDQ
jgi:phosphoribosylaminoimidazolecarboxamide formyltransferase/IMP cyclohydrolase